MCRNGIDCDWVAFSGCGLYGCLVRADGTAWCWGSNTYGQIGDGTTIDRKSPVAVEGLDNVRSIRYVGHYSCATTADGSVWCWGRNEYGQIGDGTTEVRLLPVNVSLPQPAEKIGTARGNVTALLVDGTVWSWGSVGGPSPVQMSELSDVTDIADNGTWLVTAEGGVWRWDHREPPEQINGVSNAVKVAAGDDHTCALSTQQEVWCWGSNEYGQLGDGTTNDATEPVQVVGLQGVTHVEIGSGYYTCALRNDGTAWCWGDTRYGVLGNHVANDPANSAHVQATPLQVEKIEGVIQIESTAGTNCAITEDGAAWGWGLVGGLIAPDPQVARIHVNNDDGKEYVDVPFPLLDP
ncbi:MAG: hypothetical protein ABI333_30245 [bacterium]